MKLYEAFQDKGFHTTIMTTFCVEFDAFESIVLSRLRGAECRNIMLACDAGMLGLALADAGRPPKSAGTSYLVTKARAAGAFHPKVVVQIGKNRGRLIVASANATASGLAGNLELATMIECGAENSGERQMVLAGWNYAVRFLDQQQLGGRAIDDKLRWARDRTGWLDAEAAADGLVDLADGTKAAFLAPADTGIAAQFVNLVTARRPVERLVILSPYWDRDLSALEHLRTALRPRKTVLLVDTEQKLFPVTALPPKADIKIFNPQGFDKKHFPSDNKRFIHAKMIVATVGGIDHVLVGSANCTFAALGNARRSGSNEEACLYRRLPAGELFSMLGLAAIVDRNKGIDVRKIPKPIFQDALPLKEAVDSDPGVFELAYERLTWWPATASLAKAVAQGRADLELMDAAAQPIAQEPEQLPVSGSEHAFRIAKGGRRPAFARFLHRNGTHTGLAIVACIEDLRMQTRDPLTARAEQAIRDLEANDEEGIWLLDVIQDLEAPKTSPLPPTVPRGSGNRTKNNAPAVAGELDYETFIRARHSDLHVLEGGHNSLAGTHVSAVRAALNRLLGMAGAPESQDDTEDDDDDIASALDTGDEVREAADALEQGFDPQDPEQSRKAAIELARKRRHGDAYAIADAVERYTEDLRQPDRMLYAIDMLRLRAMLTIIAVAGWPGSSAPSYKPSHVQVLPCSGNKQDETWPRLMGQVLAVVFHGFNPAIKRLKFDKGTDRIPDDVIEAWACCLWSSQAAYAAARVDAGCKRLSPILGRLAEKVQVLLPLSKAERESTPFVAVIDGLDQRFGPRLQIPPMKPACANVTSTSARQVHSVAAPPVSPIHADDGRA